MRRILAGIVCGIFVAVMLVSGFYVTTHLDHDCSGKDCNVCAIISVCEAILRCLFVLLLVQGMALAGMKANRLNRRSRSGLSAAGTLISMKVKLSC